MASLRTLFTYPGRLYHGTRIDPQVGVGQALEQFRSRLLNPVYWREGKDFGRGFYTTFDLEQAQRWAMRGIDGRTPKIPLVLEIEWTPLYHVSDYGGMIEHLIFLGPSLHWADYILDHRINRQCGCRIKHPAVVIGPAADNTAKEIVKMLNARKHGRESIRYFLEQMTQTPFGRQLFEDQLKNQIVFCDEVAEPTLQVLGYYTKTQVRKEWDYVRI